MIVIIDLIFAILLPIIAMWYVIKQNRWDKATFFLLVATNCEIGYWGARIVRLLEGME